MKVSVTYKSLFFNGKRNSINFFKFKMYYIYSVIKCMLLIELLT